MILKSPSSKCLYLQSLPFPVLLWHTWVRISTPRLMNPVAIQSLDKEVPWPVPRTACTDSTTLDHHSLRPGDIFLTVHTEVFILWNNYEFIGSCKNSTELCSPFPYIFCQLLHSVQLSINMEMEDLQWHDACLAFMAFHPGLFFFLLSWISAISLRRS